MVHPLNAYLPYCILTAYLIQEQVLQIQSEQKIQQNEVQRIDKLKNISQLSRFPPSVKSNWNPYDEISLRVFIH